jgi:hypothetical protein
MVAIWIQDDFGRIIEEHSSGSIRKEVAKTILCRVVDPFLDPDLWLF